MQNGRLAQIFFIALVEHHGPHSTLFADRKGGFVAHIFSLYMSSMLALWTKMVLMVKAHFTWRKEDCLGYLSERLTLASEIITKDVLLKTYN